MKKKHDNIPIIIEYLCCFSFVTIQNYAHKSLGANNFVSAGPLYYFCRLYSLKLNCKSGYRGGEG